MKKVLIILFTLLISVIFFNFTKIDTQKSNELTVADCDSTIIYFQEQILPILQSNCAKSGCHSEKAHRDNIVLNSYENMMRTIKFEEDDKKDDENEDEEKNDNKNKKHHRNKNSKQENDKSSDNELVKVLQRNKMPPYPHKPLSTIQKDLIYKWVEQGMQNNSCKATVVLQPNKIVSFKDDVFPIIEKNCIGCHSQPDPSDGYDFSDPEVFQTMAKTGEIYSTINHAEGVTAMPFLGDKLPQTEIDLIKKWIDEGANLD